MLAQAIRKKLGKAGKEEKGFTLIELLAVIVIIGIIAVIAIPMIGNLLSNTRDKSDLATARQVYDASRLYVLNELNGSAGDKAIPVIGTASDPGLQSKNYLESNLVLPSDKKTIQGGVVNYTGGVLSDVAEVSGTGGHPKYAVSLTTSTGTKYFTSAEIITAEKSPTP